MREGGEGLLGLEPTHERLARELSEPRHARLGRRLDGTKQTLPNSALHGDRSSDKATATQPSLRTGEREDEGATGEASLRLGSRTRPCARVRGGVSGMVCV